jgi:HAD superfamily hydrolase (TIGR01509 family)
MKYQAVLFDCDGVLVDSEPITNGVLRDMLIEQGWRISVQECFDTFVGHAVIDQSALIEKHTGQPVTAQWLQLFRDKRDAALRDRLLAVPNIHYAVKMLHDATQGRIACASGADRGKLLLQLGKVDLLPFFDGRLFSGIEQPRNKPHPDVYLAAAKALAIAPQHCAVVEDTPNGTRAGVAAGCTVWGYAPQGDGKALLQAGAHHVFTDMAHLPHALGVLAT